MATSATRQGNAALVERIYTAPSAGDLRNIITGYSVGKIIVHPAFEHKLLQDSKGAYEEYAKSIASLFQDKKDGKNTLVIYESKEDIGHVKEFFAKYGANFEPEHWLIHPEGVLKAGKGSDAPLEIVRALATNSAAIVFGGLTLDVCIRNAMAGTFQLLREIGIPDFPVTINRLIAKTNEQLGLTFWKGI